MISLDEKRALLERLLRQKAEKPKTAPLSFSQERLWFLDQLAPGSPVYNIARAITLDGPLDPAALARAVSGVVRRHEALRTTFRSEGDRPVQVVVPELALDVPLVDLASLPPERRRETAAVLSRQAAVEPFDLTRGPLVRLRLVRLAAARHLLLATFHHIVFDGGSFSVFFRELSALYRGLALPPPPLQYPVFARRQRQRLEGPTAATAVTAEIEHWRARLAGAPALLALPAARPRPAAQSFRGASARLAVPQAGALGLAGLARRAAATPFMAHLAVFAALLGRASGTEDIVVGTPVAGRDSPELEELIGFFVNSLVLRTGLQGDPTFGELLSRVRATCLDAYAHQELPFERLVEELRPERLLGHNPLFQVMFALQAPSRAGLDLPAVSATVEVVPGETSRVDLLLDLRQESTGVEGWIEYATDLFDASDMARLAAHYRILVEGAAADPRQRVSALPLLSAAEHHQLAVEWNDRSAPFPRDASVHGLFSAVAAAAGDCTALVFGFDHLSYGELEARSSRLGRVLVERGVGAEAPVALFLPRSPEMVIATLAVLKAGGCYVPLDPSHPAERQRLLLEDIGGGEASPLVLTLSGLAPRLPAGTRALCLDDTATPGRPAVSLPDTEAGVGGDRLCYVIYTSGSTGRPKGVAVSHAAVLRLIFGGIGAAVELGAGVRVGHVSNTAFDAATFEIWGALLLGATLSGLSREEALTPRGLASAFAAGRVDILFLTATLFHQVAREDPEAFAPLRALLFGGEAADPAWVRAVAGSAAPPGRLLNGYGPTESTTFAVVHEARSRELPADAASVPIGRPIGNTEAYVLDRWFVPQPIGVAGELCLGGEGLARGYLGRPERTAERFVPHPLAERPGARLYRTGDLVRALPDGVLDLLGRLDGQVKVRGFRVELGEVEAALRRHPAVAAAAAALRQDGEERRLVGYVVPREAAGERALLAGLRSFLKPLLPEPMIPAVFQALPELPVNANGKVDRQALARLDPGELATERLAASLAAIAPRTPVEEALAGLWSELLGRERVGVEEDFFALGGHSLLATRVLARVRQLFGVDPGIRALFDAPTVAGLAREVERERESAAGAAGPVLRRLPRSPGADLPASFGQRRLWFLDRLRPGSSLYNMPIAYRLVGGWKPGWLTASLGEIVRRHESLRTTFVESAEGPQQVIAAAGPALCQVDLLGLPAPRGQAEGERLASEQAHLPFDLARGPLFRPILLGLASGEQLLLLSMHHLISDGWSVGVLRRELGTLYGALAQGTPSPLAELPVQYADFAAWQRQWLAGPLLARQLAYWRQRLAGHPPVLELPSDRPRPPVQSFRGDLAPVRLGAELTGELVALSRKSGAPLFMTVLAGWNALLGRYTGQEDVLVGVPSAGRTRVELEGLIGFFVNTLVLRTDLSGDPGFAALLARVRESALGAYAHGDLPLERLVEELAPERTLSHSPLFQVAFDLESGPAAPGSMAAALPDGLRWEERRLASRTAKFDLTLGLADSAEGLAGELSYSLDLFDPTTARRMAGHLRTLLKGAARNPALRLSALPLLAEPERAQALWEWNDTARRLPAPLAHERFEMQARTRPAAVALVAGPARLTYGELEARANRLAHHLRALGVGPEVRVAIGAERTPERVLGMLAVLKAGGAFVSLDPAYPRERLAVLLAEAGAPVLLTEERFADHFPASGATVIRLDRDAAALPGLSGMPGDRARPPVSGACPEHLAYVIFTSGSTGHPKGVAVPHAGLRNLVHWYESAATLGPADHATEVASPAFDASILEVWPLLAAGATLHIADEETRLSARRFVHWWVEQGITSSFLPTPLAEALLEEGIPPGLAHGVRSLSIGGDRLHRRPDPAMGFRLLNLYGPAESSVVATASFVVPKGAESGGGFASSPPIGRAIDNTRLYILDRQLALVPAGVPGEIYVAGGGLARGYLDRPEGTAERFLPDPWAALHGESGARMYRTGDRVRWRPDGDLDFLGRADSQVKLRGMRVELGEIEAVLLRHAGVREAAVLLREDRPEDRRLAAYVVPAAGLETPEVTALQGWLERHLPAPMVPQDWVVLDRLPLTANGKVDRRALPAPERRPGGGAAPRTPLEEVLAGIFCQVLKLEQVGIEDDFFALGGHSLLATQVVARVRQTLAVELPLRVLFEAPTIAGLAGAITAERRPDGVPPAPPLRRGERGPGTRPPLSFAQQRLWFIDRLEPGSPLYNVPADLRLAGPLKVAALAAALAEIVGRHEALRTTFAEIDGEPAQIIAPADPGSRDRLRQVDLTALAEPRREAELGRLAAAEAERPFDLARGPLLRTTLVRLAGEEHALFLSLHHIVADGWSMGVLLRELSELYAAALAGRPSPLPEPPIQYADFALWQRGWLQGARLEGELDYWRRHLDGTPAALDLPTDRPRPAVQSFRGATLPARFPPARGAAVAALARELSATPFMVLLAAFQALLGRYTRQVDVSVGSPIAGRTHREMEELIGFFVNTLVLRTDLSGAPTFAELVGRVREVALAAHAHQDVPFERLVEALEPERSLSHTPLFQVMFMLQNAAVDYRLEGLSVTPFEAERRTAKFDLLLGLWARDGGLGGALEHSTDLFDGTTAARLLLHFDRLLAGALAAPSTAIGELGLLAAAERAQLLAEWNDTAAPRSTASRLDDFFTREARRHPDRVALVFGAEQLTYGALAARTGRLANALIRRGVGPEVPVAMSVARSLALVEGLLAIFRAGGYCVPLDPTYPAERLAFMLADAAAPVLLADAGSLALLPPFGGELLRLDDSELGAALGRERAEAPAGGLPENLAYIIYTSGSTGTPKGIAMPHRAIVNIMEYQIRRSGGAAERTLQFSPLSFDVCFQEFFSTWAVGGTVVLISDPDRRDALALLGVLERHEVRRLFLPFVALMNLIEMAEQRSAVPAALEEVVTAGEQLRVSDRLAGWFGRLAHCRLENQYGPSEAHVVTTFPLAGPPAGRPADWPALPPVGRPVLSTRVYALDARLEPVPIGVPGEVYVGGVQLARGYLGRPDVTAERFLPDRWGGEPGGRLYRTGDLARVLPGGNLEFLGRVDFQVKVRGFRIELGEIEAVLATHEVVTAVVVEAPEIAGLRRLIAYVVAPGLAVSELRRFLAERLPAYMIPSHFMLLEALPVAATGKVDRRALPLPDPGLLLASYVAPRSALEEEVAAVWAEVLGVERVGIHDSFWDLGGHSLLATQVLSRLRRIFAVELSLRTFFEQPTVAGLAGAVREAVSATQEPIPRRPVGPGAGPPPLSFAQQRLWLLSGLVPASLYNLPVPIRLEGWLDVSALAASLTAVVRRHEALRTSFPEIPESPDEAGQAIAPANGVPLPCVDLSALPPELREAAERRLAGVESARPLDLARGPLLKACLFRTGEAEHLLLLVLHHIVGDGWSIGILFRELSTLYEYFAADAAGATDAAVRPSPLPELPIQYADYAVWQRSFLHGERRRQELDFWRQRLTDLPPLELPTDRPRPAVQRFRGGHRWVRLAPAETAALRALARSRSASLYTGLLAGFAAFLGRLARQEDLAVGSFIANRHRAEIEPLIGFFVNTLVLRADLAGDPPFVDLLGRMRETTLAADAHQDLPFERLVEELNPVRDSRRNPLVQAVFSLQNAPLVEPVVAGVRFALSGVESATSRFDLWVSLWERDDSLHGFLEYDSDLFTATTAERWARAFEHLLGAVAAHPEARLSSLPLLSAAERQQLSHEWNDTGTEIDEAATLDRLFAAQATRTPEATALVVGEERLSYGELARRADRLARRLATLGVGPEVPVALYLPRTADLVIALLATVSAGGFYVPLDPAHPVDRLAYLLEDSGAAVLVTHRELADRAPAPAVLSLRRLLVDGEEGAEEVASPLSSPGLRASPANLAYLLYTSGSTGRPKGVQVTHRSLAGFLAAMRRRPGLTSTDVLLSVATIAFDISALEIFLPLVVGAQVVLVERGTAMDGELLRAALERSAATIFQATPATWQLLVEAGWRGERLTALTGAEALPAGLAGRLLARVGALWNLYGPTETTVWASLQPLAPPAEVAAIGRPIEGVRFHLSGPALEPVPIGVAGELLIGGSGVARGYRGRPELTAERFVPDPSGDEPGARLYRTGDLARLQPDGAVEFLGRLDHQVKVRGFRIEPGEIEAALTACPGVATAAVLARTDGPGGLRLVAYVAPEDLSVAALKSALADRLPSYMVPAGWVLLPKLPLTPTGKLDRRALPAPDWGALAADEGFVAPRDPVEATIAGLWAEVLPVAAAEIGARTDFFAIGGHSLLATQVLSRLRRAFQVELSLRVFFEHPTVAGQARAVLAAGAGSAAGAPIPRRAADGTPVPLSFAQQRLWFLSRVVASDAFYNLPVALQLAGRLDVAALAASLAEVVHRHEALRTVFPTDESTGEAVQVILPGDDPFPLPRVDLAALPRPAREAESRRLAGAESARPFDLTRGPLFRARLFRLGEEEHLLLLVLHHIVADGWSIGVLLRELSLLYSALSTGRPSPLAELPIQYADFAVWQRTHLAGEPLERQLDYWRERLAGLVPLELPTDLPRPPVQRFRGARRPLALPPAVAAALRGLARDHGASLYTVLLAGFAAFLSRIVRQEDLAVGTFIANRHREEVEPLIGLFVNTLVMRTDLAGDPLFAELLARVRESALAADAHQDLPFERLVEELNPVRDASRNPLVQVVFALQNAPLAEPVAAGVRFELVAVENASSRFDLSATLWERGDGLFGALEYNLDLFTAATAERWAASFTRLLGALAADPALPLSSLPLLSPAERHQLLAEWNDTGAPEMPATVDRLFAAQAARTPEATALVVGAERLSYGELGRRADRLGRRLAALGVGPEAAVALFLSRTADLVVALLGTLAAGGFYLPLDPTYPAERLDYLLADSGAAILVTNRELAGRAPARPHARVLLVDEEDGWPALPALPSRVADPRDSASLAYLLYTSGSTGRPKGVQVSHGALVNFLASMRREPGLTSRDVLLSVTTISFDIAALEIYLPLLVGAQVVLVDRGTAVDGEMLRAELERSAATVLQATPSTWQLLVEADWRGEHLTALCGGEALPPGLAGRILARAGSLWNLYGPTETTVWSAVRPIAAPAEAASIGRPIGNTQLQIRHATDTALEPIPIGVAGELLIGGAGLARGYRGRPDLTAERFIPDPQAAEPGARLYRTGDLARFQADGAIEFLGRLDHQVKLRGFRIEPGEIEAVLTACPGVTAAAVLARADGPGDLRLVAYAAPEDLSVSALRAALHERLPDYMVPTGWVLLPALPLTANGKIDRRALPAPDPEVHDSAYVAPCNRVEEILAEVCAEVLRLPRMGIEDNFFAVGGDSIRTIQVVARCRQQGLRLTPQQMFRHQTIASLAAVLDAPAAPLAPVDDPHDLPLAMPAGKEGRFTPSDFPGTALLQEDLDEILEEIG